MSSPYQPVPPQLSPQDLEPTSTDPIVAHYTPELANALQRAASLGIKVNLPQELLKP
jgi:hypothetical protein